MFFEQEFPCITMLLRSTCSLLVPSGMNVVDLAWIRSDRDQDSKESKALIVLCTRDVYIQYYPHSIVDVYLEDRGSSSGGEEEEVQGDRRNRRRKYLSLHLLPIREQRTLFNIRQSDERLKS